MGPTLVSYLRGAGAVGTGARAGDAEKAAIAGRDWSEVDGLAVGAVATGGPTAGLTAPAGGGEERRTRGLKLCLSQVRAMFR